MKNDPTSRVRYVVAIVVVGALAGAFAVAFRAGLGGAMLLLFGADNVFDAFRTMGPAERVLVPAIGGLAAGALMTALERQAGGHAIGDILETVALGRGEIALPRVLVKSVASFVAQVGGASVGREGAIIQFGAAIGSTVARRVSLDRAESRVLIAAGTAAGFAAAYNTPVAAILFVLEIVTGVVTLEIVLPVAVAVTTSTLLTRAAIGPGPLYGERTFALTSWAELPLYAALGLLCGVVGAAFVWGLSRTEQAVQRVALPRMVRAGLGGLAVGLLALFVPAVTGNGYEAIQTVLDGSTVGLVLLAWLVAKLIATTTSVASGAPGGVFTPSMFFGAALGGLVGATVLPSLSGAYALVGMAAMIAATTHAPLMAAALVFELSGDYEIVLPLLISTGVAAVVSRRLQPQSVYTEELHRRGIDWEGPLVDRLARSIRARELVHAAPATIAPGGSLADVLARFEAGARVVYVDGTPPLAINLRAVWQARQAVGERPPTAVELGRPVPTALLDDTLHELTDKLWALDWPEIPVLEGGVIVGTVTRRDLLRAFDHELFDRASLLTRQVGEPAADAVDIELPRGLAAAWIGAPSALIGQRLEATAWHEDHDVHVVAVRSKATPAGARRVGAPGQGPVGPDDEILVLGAPAAIHKLGST